MLLLEIDVFGGFGSVVALHELRVDVSFQGVHVACFFDGPAIIWAAQFFEFKSMGPPDTLHKLFLDQAVLLLQEHLLNLSDVLDHFQNPCFCWSPEGQARRVDGLAPPRTRYS